MVAYVYLQSCSALVFRTSDVHDHSLFAFTGVLINYQHYYSACLNVVNTAKVADHLRGHPEGLHISKLATLAKLDENQLARILRMLAIKHCFTEGADHATHTSPQFRMLIMTSFSGRVCQQSFKHSSSV